MTKIRFPTFKISSVEFLWNERIQPFDYGRGSTVFTVAFGAIRINATTRLMRQVQFGGKILFDCELNVKSAVR